MRMAVSHKVFSITLAAGGVFGGVLAGVFQQFAVIRANNARVLKLAIALQAQQSDYMMHDALRGGAIAAMLGWPSGPQPVCARERAYRSPLGLPT